MAGDMVSPIAELRAVIQDCNDRCLYASAKMCAAEVFVAWSITALIRALAPGPSPERAISSVGCTAHNKKPRPSSGRIPLKSLFCQSTTRLRYDSNEHYVELLIATDRRPIPRIRKRSHTSSSESSCKRIECSAVQQAARPRFCASTQSTWYTC